MERLRRHENEDTLAQVFKPEGEDAVVLGSDGELAVPVPKTLASALQFSGRP